MKVAKNMDSVFADCTADELDFEAFFDKDDCLIDMVAGLDEAGNYLTGEYLTVEDIAEAVDPLEDDDEAERAGVCPICGNSECTCENAYYVEAFDEAFELLVDDVVCEGMADAVKAGKNAGAINKQGKLKSVADKAGKIIDKDVPVNKATDAANKAAVAASKTVDSATKAHLTKVAEKGAKNGDDKATIKQKVKAAWDKLPEKVKKAVPPAVVSAVIVSAVAAGVAIYNKKKKSKDKEDEKQDNTENTNEAYAELLAERVMEAVLSGISLDEAINECCDAAERAGSVKHDTSNVEGIKGASLLAGINGKSFGDIIEDEDDAKMRSGSVKRDTNNIEGVHSKVVVEELDPIEDQDDSKMREGSASRSTKKIEGVTNKSIGQDIVKDKDDSDMRDGKESRDTKNIEGAATKALDEELDIEIEEEYDINIEEEVGNIDDQVDPIDQGLLSGVNKDGKIVDDSINVAGISNNINPDRERQSYKESTLEFLMNKILEATEEEKIVDDDAEGDDEIVDLVIKGDQDSSGKLDLDYEYDDDELIDLVISGKNLE